MNGMLLEFCCFYCGKNKTKIDFYDSICHRFAKIVSRMYFVAYGSCFYLTVKKLPIKWLCVNEKKKKKKRKNGNLIDIHIELNEQKKFVTILIDFDAFSVIILSGKPSTYSEPIKWKICFGVFFFKSLQVHIHQSNNLLFF